MASQGAAAEAASSWELVNVDVPWNTLGAAVPTIPVRAQGNITTPTPLGGIPTAASQDYLWTTSSVTAQVESLEMLFNTEKCGDYPLPIYDTADDYRGAVTSIVHGEDPGGSLFFVEAGSEAEAALRQDFKFGGYPTTLVACRSR